MPLPQELMVKIKDIHDILGSMAQPFFQADPITYVLTAKRYSIVEFTTEVCGITLFPKQAIALTDFYESKITYEELQLVWGRKGGKTLVSAVILLYEVFKLLLLDDPHRHYHILRGQNIYALLVSIDETQAINVALNYVKTIAHNSWFFKPLIVKENNEELHFLKNLVIRAQSSSSRSSRGYPCIVILFDELAWFLDTKGNMSGKAVYEALKPNIKVFKGDGKIVSISSPAGKSGIFWDNYNIAMKPGSSILMFQAATWEVNPEITYEMLKPEFDRDPVVANMEYGALFADVVDAFLNREKLEGCKKITLISEFQMNKSKQRVVALDPGLKHDRYALVMGYLEGQDAILDYVKVWQGTQDKPVQISEVEAHMELLNKNFNVVLWVMDQHQSAATIQKYQKQRWNIKETFFSQNYNQEIYTALNHAINEYRIVLPDHPLTLQELHFLQRIGAGRNFKVQAPETGSVTTDDCADALANCHFQLRILSRVELAYTITDLGRGDGPKDVMEEEETEDFICEWCEDEFKTAEELRKHQETCGD